MRVEERGPEARGPRPEGEQIEARHGDVETVAARPRAPGLGPRALAVDNIRAQFPALQRRHAGKSVAYFDGPGGTQVPRMVAEAITDYLYHHNANTHWAYPSSVETDAAIAGARQAMADLLNASPDEIAFGQNMTTLTFHLARALGRGWRAGDEVVVTELDHQANVAPWRALEQEKGIVIRVAKMIPETGQLDWDDVERRIGERTRLVAIGAASNALGTVSDVARAARLAHAAGALCFVDAVHYAPHALVDVKALDCDFLACSAYKFYGPHIGALYGRRALIESLDVPKLAPAPNSSPERLETGTLSHEAIVGTGATVDFLASLATAGTTRRERLEHTFAALHDRGEALFARLWDGLGEIRGVRRYGAPPKSRRTPTIAFTVQGVPSEQVARGLADRAVFASNGDFYASVAVARLGLEREGLVRAGAACYTTAEEVDRLVAAVYEVAR